MQWPHFAERGLNLSRYYPGTINVSIAPARYKVKQAWKKFRSVKWSETEPAEDFSFFECRLRVGGGVVEDGLIYYPHPETKPDHFQPDDVLEILAPEMEGVREGVAVVLEVRMDQLVIR